TGDCVVEETFLPTSGGGASRAMYDGRTGEWARVWLEPGRMLIFISGGIENGDMIMLGGTTGSAQLTNRSIWEPQGANRVRQFTQTSANNGATWTNSGFDAIYVPRGTATPPPPPPPPSGGGGGGALGGLELLLASLLLLLKKPAVRLTLLGLVLAGCGGGGGGGSAAPPSTATPYQYVMPAQLNDGWAVENATAEGVDVARLGSMMNAIRQNGQDGYLRNILVVRNNKLVFEEYFADGGRDSLSHMQSATKSIVAAIFGIAVSEGYVASLDDSLFGYFPEYAQYASAEKDAVRVRHVLSMTPGFAWNENSAPTFGTENDNIAAYRSNNYIGYLLQKDLVTTPGAAWNYNSGCPMLLAGIIRNQSGVHLDDFAEQRFFGAMGISRLRWEYQADGLPLATGGLWLRGRDAAKIGQLFLDGGSWQGQQVVPADWVEQSLTQVISPGSGRGYGFLWWTQQRSGRRIWYAAGYGGQLIVLVPSESAIIITNANYVRDGAENNRRQAAIWNLLDSYILPAL
ncbi:MAG: serine hydrolase, partial [Woeseiaceae bacterium]|nr:serine hydrolase [Woeseiaceae bacterium]